MTKAQEFRKQMADTRKDVIRITLTGGDGDVTKSKVGGTPYWPKNGEEYPRMIFLAQVNLSEVPETGLLPKEGMLQFFIADSSDWGLFKGKNGFRVVYHEKIGEPADVCLLDSDISPVVAPAMMGFTKDTEMMSLSDRLFPEAPEDIEKEVFSNDDFYGAGNKLLGYPNFTQTDPRQKRSKYDTLLFQLDSDDFTEWGDCGVANFFINGKKLRNGDFSDVLYNWDCC